MKIVNGYKIDKNVPLPPIKRKAELSVFTVLKVGDSFFVPKPKGEIRPSIVNNANYYAQRYTIKLTTRKVVENGIEGYRVWRLE